MKDEKSFDICSKDQMKSFRESTPLKVAVKVITSILPVILKTPQAIPVILSVFPEAGLFPFSVPVQADDGEVCSFKTGDHEPCSNCGNTQFRRTGTCYVCLVCGSSQGCS